MKKIVISISLIIASLGCGLMPQQAYGMETNLKTETEKQGVEGLGRGTLKFAEKMLTHADKLIDKIPAPYKTKVCICAAVVGVGGALYASYETIKFFPKIIVIAAVSGISLYVAYRTYQSKSSSE